MGAVISVPFYPGAVSYDVDYSDPSGGNPNEPNPFGTWTTLQHGLTSPSSIPDATGNEQVRLYRVRPNVTIASTTVPLQWYPAFSYNTTLFDPQITAMLPAFRDSLGDYGATALASTDQDLDSGAGVGLLSPDGSQTSFSLAEAPDSTPPVVLENSVKVVKNGLTLHPNTDYVVDYDSGTVNFAAAPLISDTLSITYKEVRYSNRMLNSSLQLAIDSLATYKINGYSVSDDQNVKVVNGALTNAGLKPIVFAIALKILNRAAIRKKSDEARSYKSDSFSFDSAPGRAIEGMAAMVSEDDAQIKSMANKYIQTATYATSRSEYDSFWDMSGRLPIFSPTAYALSYSGYSYWL